jgi:hypothetical protein
MKRKSVLLIVFVFVSLFSIRAAVETDSIYAHVSYIDNEVFVIRAAEDKPVQAVVNLPLLTGDTVFTEDKGRCEIQFGNGTLIRLDNNTRLKVGTVLTKGLTTGKKITTLELDQGHIYSMNQVYRGEIFQVITGAAAVKMVERSTNSILVKETEGTHVRVDRGKVGVLYGKSSKKVFVGKGKGLWISPGYELKDDNGKKNEEFYLWNRNVNKNFKDLHYGKSKVPEVIYRRSPGIVHFAERFSTKYGTWVYNDILGYVWQPADEIFVDRRPFFDANYVKVNGELVLVPNQPWGWAPAHLGTWFFSKSQGWVWIPGDGFSEGICAVGLKGFEDGGMYNMMYRIPTGLYLNALNYWVDRMYGDIGLYGIYRRSGGNAWRKAYANKYHKSPIPLKRVLENAPEHVKSVITKIEKTSYDKIALEFKSIKTAAGLAAGKINILRDVTPGKNAAGGNVLVKMARDWNPDARWAKRNGVKIFYSAKDGAILCPELKLSSKTITNHQRTMLKRSVNKESIKKGTAFRASASNGSGTNSQGSGKNAAKSGKASSSGSSTKKAAKK